MNANTICARLDEAISPPEDFPQKQKNDLMMNFNSLSSEVKLIYTKFIDLQRTQDEKKEEIGKHIINLKKTVSNINKLLRE